jgi:large subunit ribosomal protein L29
MKKSESKKNLTGKTPAELQTELEALLREQFGLRMQAATQQLQDTSKLQNVRRGIARVRTMMGRKAPAGAPMAKVAKAAQVAKAAKAAQPAKTAKTAKTAQRGQA